MKHNQWFLQFPVTNNLFVTSKKRNHEFTNSPIHEFKVLQKGKRAKPLYIGVLFLIYYFKKHFKHCFFILKALKDILQHFFGALK